MTGGAQKHVLIVGAGLAGSMLAGLLGQRGYRVTVCERRDDPRVSGAAGGRSINLALSTRGLYGLEKLGLDRQVLADAVPMRGRMVHRVHDGQTSIAFQPYSKNPDEAINSVSRGGLNLTLVEAAEARDDVTFCFGRKCVDVDLDEAAATFEIGPSKEQERISADVVIGTDGAFSAVRNRLQRTDCFQYSQDYLEHGYKELTIPSNADGSFKMEAQALHIWPHGGYMMIALPNKDGSFTCTCFWPHDGENSFQALETEQDVAAFFESRFPDAVPLMPTLIEDFESNPVSSLVTVRCSPWHWKDRVLVLGDAAHAIVPFYGQGMNAAFEDCAVLDDMLEQHGDDWATVLPLFSARRKPNADAIADLAIANFVEMRDHVSSGTFLLKKKFEKLLHRFFPSQFVPLYHMVTFTRIDYAESRERAAHQTRVVKTAIGVISIVVFLLLIYLIRGNK